MATNNNKTHEGTWYCVLNAIAGLQVISKLVVTSEMSVLYDFDIFIYVFYFSVFSFLFEHCGVGFL